MPSYKKNRSEKKSCQPW